jgi:uncharacterized membrane protein YhaH (DUF805 family)
MFDAYRRYFVFSGRSGRREYWLFLGLIAAQFCLAVLLDVVFFDG